jgi:hypothetical protein
MIYQGDSETAIRSPVKDLQHDTSSLGSVDFIFSFNALTLLSYLQKKATGFLSFRDV